MMPAASVRATLALLLAVRIPAARAAAPSTSAAAPQRSTTRPPRSLREAVAWLEVKSFEMIRACRRTMANGVAAFPPQVGTGYEAFWLRDYAYMLEGKIEAFTWQELQEACDVFLEAQRSDGAMVDAVKFDGTPVYMPGMGTLGLHPVADGSQFAVSVAWHTCLRTRDTARARAALPKLIRAMDAVPRNPATGLVHIRPGDPQDRCPYGFTDTVRKQGDELFCSLLLVEADRRLAGLLRFVNRNDEARARESDADRVADAINRVFWDEQVGLYRAATVRCREHDIWGSAFAVRLDVADVTRSRRIAAYFKEHYHEIVKRGQVRHLPGGVYWEQAGERDRYQNGAYWAVPVGWFVYALDLADAGMADQTVIDLVRDFMEQEDVNECINDGYRNVSRYVASAALPLEGIRAMLARREAVAASRASR